jgi:hypothetical protein
MVVVPAKSSSPPSSMPADEDPELKKKKAMCSSCGVMTHSIITQIASPNATEKEEQEAKEGR